MSKIFETRMEVRDYECDIEGIVNNANYLHYMEHTRHLFLKACGLSFAEMHAKGTDAVVHRIDIQYKSPLRCDDEFISRLHITKSTLRYTFLGHPAGQRHETLRPRQSGTGLPRQWETCRQRGL